MLLLLVQPDTSRTTVVGHLNYEENGLPRCCLFLKLYFNGLFSSKKKYIYIYSKPLRKVHFTVSLIPMWLLLYAILLNLVIFPFENYNPSSSLFLFS